jgi:hypothetical protein
VGIQPRQQNRFAFIERRVAERLRLKPPGGSKGLESRHANPPVAIARAGQKRIKTASIRTRSEDRAGGRTDARLIMMKHCRKRRGGGGPISRGRAPGFLKRLRPAGGNPADQVRPGSKRRLTHSGKHHLP